MQSILLKIHCNVVNVHDIAVVYNVHRVPLVLLALVMCLV